MFKKLMLIVFVITLLPATQPGATQDNEPVLVPRFRDGAAIIQRPVGYDQDVLQTAMTPDNQWVIAPGGQAHSVIFRWDIRGIEDVPFYPEPAMLDVSDLLPDVPRDSPSVVTIDETAVVQFDAHLVRIDVPSFTISDSLDVRDLFSAEITKRFGALETNNSMVAALFDTSNSVVVWDLASGEIATRQFEDSVNEIYPFRDGWIFKPYGAGVHYFCDAMLTNCVREEVDAEFVLQVDDVLVFGTSSLVEAHDNYQTAYYTFDNGLVPTEPLFPQLPTTRHVPLSISPDGEFMVVGSPFPEGEAPVGSIADRYYGVWRVDGTEELRRMHGNGLPFWFGDHSLAQDVKLLDATSPLVFDEFDLEDYSINLSSVLIDFHAFSGLSNVSPDGSHLMFNTLWAALVMTTGPQRIDDLATVGAEISRVNHPEFEARYMSADGQKIVMRNEDTLTRLDLLSGEEAAFDAGPYRQGDNPVDVLARDEDMFVLGDNTLLWLNLTDMSILQEIAVDDVAALSPGWAFGLYEREGVVLNRDVVGALFENTLIVWSEETGAIKTAIDGRGIQLHAAPDGWLVYSTNFETPEHLAIVCDMMLTACDTHQIDQQILTFDGDSLIVGGDIFRRETGKPSYWLLDNGIESVEPLFDIPDSYLLRDFSGDYVVIWGHGSQLDAHRNDVWSRSENRRIEPFNGSWHWLGMDYLVYLENGMLTFLHLPDGRFRRWRPEVEATDFEIAGDRLLVITETEFILYNIFQ